MHLSWNAPADGGAPITGYNLYRGTAAGGETLAHEPRQRRPPTTTPRSRTAPTYYYRVAAVNSVGEGTQSNEVSATPAAPAAPAAAVPAHRRARQLRAVRRRARRELAVAGTRRPGTVTIAEQRPDQEQRRRRLGDLELATFTADQEAYLAVPTLPTAGSSSRSRDA